MKRLAFHPSAEREIERSAKYYEGKQSGLAARFQAALDHSLDAISRKPNIGARYGRAGYLKVHLKVFPYIVYYLVQDDCVWIASVAHDKRRPNYWASRRPS